ncbi:MAG: YheO-like PAS domain protein [Firmicutes bacterium ADurb.Bin153]|nr:MAG: YheO-like PAS domain protein [Firmicutes bacterium ADurb.Bin153]
MIEKPNSPILEVLISVARGIATTMGQSCEVVVHDLSKPKSSVIAVFNNSVTGRQVGEGIRDLVHTVLRSPDFKDEMLANYQTVTKDGKHVKSTTIVIRDENKNVIGALCINFDLSTFVSTKRFFEDFTKVNNLLPPEDKVVNISNADVLDIIDHIIKSTIMETGKSIEQMTKEDKMQVIQYLDEKGVFLVRGSVNWVAGKLKLSRNTVYNYLENHRSLKNIKE